MSDRNHLTPPEAASGAASDRLPAWRRRRMERRVVRLERRLRNLDKHRHWESDFARWGPAQEAMYERDRAALVVEYDALRARLGVI